MSEQFGNIRSKVKYYDKRIFKDHWRFEIKVIRKWPEVGGIWVKLQTMMTNQKKIEGKTLKNPVKPQYQKKDLRE